MRMIVMGTGPFAVPMFRSLIDSGQPVAALVTRPAHGTGTPPPNPMRITAESLGLPVVAPESINSPEAHAALMTFRPDLFVVCDYGQILKPETLALAPCGGINLHGSLLPRYRGAAPIQRAILAGETQTGVTVIHMTPRLDGGPILTTRSTEIWTDETAVELETRLAQMGVSATNEALSLLEKWDRSSPLGTEQDSRLASKAPRLRKAEGAVDWQSSATFIERQVRALKPWPNTHTFWIRPGQAPLRLILDQVRALPPGSGAPGQITSVDRGQVRVATGDGELVLLRVQPAGKRVMSMEEFLRGYSLQAGQMMGTSGDEHRV